MSLTEIWFLLRSAWPCDYPTHIRKQSHITTASYWYPVQHNKLMIYLTLNLWLQSAGRTGSTEMTPVRPETGRHSQIFRRNTLERSAPNRLTSRRKPCLGSAWPQRETWFTSKDEKYWNFTVLSEAMHVLCGYFWSKLGMLEGYRWCHVCIKNIMQ